MERKNYKHFERYPQLYMLLSECEMLNNQQFYGKQTNIHDININGNNIVVSNPDIVNKLTDLLAQKETALNNAQKQINMLLEIINNLTNEKKHQ